MPPDVNKHLLTQHDRVNFENSNNPNKLDRTANLISIKNKNVSTVKSSLTHAVFKLGTDDGEIKNNKSD